MAPSDDRVAPLTIRCLGTFAIQVRGIPLPPLHSRKGYWLLALLTLRQGSAIERSWVAGTFWPDASESRALAHLRRTLTDLRHALGAEAMRFCSPTPRTLRLDLTGCEVDLFDFDAAITRGDSPSLEQAVRLYRGPLLVGHHGGCEEP